MSSENDSEEEGEDDDVDEGPIISHIHRKSNPFFDDEAKEDDDFSDLDCLSLRRSPDVSVLFLECSLISWVIITVIILLNLHGLTFHLV